jgi:hypothetical protein
MNLMLGDRWKVEFEAAEDSDPLTLRYQDRLRLYRPPTKMILKFYCDGVEVFKMVSVSSGSMQDPIVDLSMIDGKHPLIALVEDANRWRKESDDTPS